MAKDNLIAKLFMLFVGVLLSKGFIQVITEIVKDSVWQMKFFWPILLFLLTLADIISYYGYGVELITSFLEWCEDLWDDFLDRIN